MPPPARKRNGRAIEQQQQRGRAIEQQQQHGRAIEQQQQHGRAIDPAAEPCADAPSTPERNDAPMLRPSDLTVDTSPADGLPAEVPIPSPIPQLTHRLRVAALRLRAHPLHLLLPREPAYTCHAGTHTVHVSRRSMAATICGAAHSWRRPHRAGWSCRICRERRRRARRTTRRARIGETRRRQRTRSRRSWRVRRARGADLSLDGLAMLWRCGCGGRAWRPVRGARCRRRTRPGYASRPGHQERPVQSDVVTRVGTTSAATAAA